MKRSVGSNPRPPGRGGCRWLRRILAGSLVPALVGLLAGPAAAQGDGLGDLDLSGRPRDAAPSPPMGSLFAPVRRDDRPADPGAATAGAAWVPNARGAQDPVGLRVAAPVRPAAGRGFTVTVDVVMDAGFHVYSPEEKQGESLEITPEPVAGVTWEAPRYPAGTLKKMELLGASLEQFMYEGVVRVEVPGRLAEGATPPGPLRFKVYYQACSDSACYLAQERIVEVAWGARFEDPRLAEHGPPPATAAPGAAAAGRPDGFQRELDKGLLWMLLVAYFWGLAASLSPCVYPMIPVTVAFFGGQDPEKKRSRTVALALTYVLGIVLSYAVLGVLLARAGQDLGSVMVHPGVVALVSGVLAAMGLSLFGLFEIRMPSALQERLSQGEGRGFAGAFVTGAVLGLVASPCVGPFAASILLFVARSGDPLVGFAALASFGFGLGTLFLVLALGAASLPRSGAWMVGVKEFFGWVLIGSSLWFASALFPEAVVLLGWGVFLAIGGVLGGALEPADTTGSRARRGLALVLVAAGLYLVVAGTARYAPVAGLAGSHGSGAVSAVPGSGAPELRWAKGYAEAKSRAATSGKPIFLDYYADWCIPCKQMDREVFPDPGVARLLSRFEIGKVDCTEPNSVGARQKREELQSLAMPYLAVFDASGKHRPELSAEGYLGAAEFEALLGKALAALGA